jgi:hypothetical protein
MARQFRSAPTGQSLADQGGPGRDDQLGVLAKVFAVRRDGRGVGGRRSIGRAVRIPHFVGEATDTASAGIRQPGLRES